MIVLEACVDSVESAIIAARAGAHRVELCANLVEGGTTPSAGSIEAAVAAVDADVMVMIRPRGGDFVYGPGELDIMLGDIAATRRAGASGVVLGCLTPLGEIDAEATRSLVEAARPLSVTFHRAFDLCRDPFEGLESIIDLGVDRLLTSGHESTAIGGLDLIAALVGRAGDRITIMPGVGIDSLNVQKVATLTRAREFHVFAENSRPSPMRFRREHVPMGRPYVPDEYLLLESDEAEISAIARALETLPAG